VVRSWPTQVHDVNVGLHYCLQVTTPFATQAHMFFLEKISFFLNLNFCFLILHFQKEKDPQNQMRTFYAPKGTHQVRKFGAIPPTDPDDIRFLTNFRISGVKKLLGANPSPLRCALASIGYPLPTVKFLGRNAHEIRTVPFLSVYQNRGHTVRVEFPVAP